MNLFERRSLTISIALHVFAVLIALFGFPQLSKPDPEPFVMSIEVVPIGEITNLKSQNKPLQLKKEAEAPKTQKPVTPTVKEKPAEPAPPKDAVPLPEEKSEEKKKPKEQPEEKKKPEENEDELAVLLNKLKQEAESKKDAKDDTSQEENKTISDKEYDDSLPLSITETDAIRGQFVKCWRMPAGSRDAHELAVVVKVEVSPEGEVLSAELAPGQSGKYNSNTFFRAAADAAIRAVHKCSPLQNLPADKYGTWREMEINFDPQELLF